VHVVVRVHGCVACRFAVGDHQNFHHGFFDDDGATVRADGGATVRADGGAVGVSPGAASSPSGRSSRSCSYV
jgi:hypothetical protein